MPSSRSHRDKARHTRECHIGLSTGNPSIWTFASLPVRPQNAHGLNISASLLRIVPGHGIISYGNGPENFSRAEVKPYKPRFKCKVNSRVHFAPLTIPGPGYVRARVEIWAGSGRAWVTKMLPVACSFPLTRRIYDSFIHLPVHGATPLTNNGNSHALHTTGEPANRYGGLGALYASQYSQHSYFTNERSGRK